MTAMEWDVLVRSLMVAGLCVIIMLPIGFALAWMFSRWRFRGIGLLEGIVHLPLVLPPIVVGYLLLLSLGRQGWIGSWLETFLGFRLAFTWWAAVIASGVMGLPLLVRAIRQSLDAVDPGYEQAAATLGANPLRRVFTVTLPLAWPGVVTGMILCFARSLGEFGATVAFAGNIPGQTQTLSTSIYQSLQVPGGESLAWRMVMISVVIAIAAMLVAEVLARKGRRHAES